MYRKSLLIERFLFDLIRLIIKIYFTLKKSKNNLQNFIYCVNILMLKLIYFTQWQERTGKELA